MRPLLVSTWLCSVFTSKNTLSGQLNNVPWCGSAGRSLTLTPSALDLPSRLQSQWKSMGHCPRVGTNATSTDKCWPFSGEGVESRVKAPGKVCRSDILAPWWQFTLLQAPPPLPPFIPPSCSFACLDKGCEVPAKDQGWKGNDGEEESGGADIWFGRNEICSHVLRNSSTNTPFSTEPRCGLQPRHVWSPKFCFFF